MTLYNVEPNKRILFDPLTGELYSQPSPYHFLMNGLTSALMNGYDLPKRNNTLKILKFEGENDDE